ncbi:MarR family transcriptional regulator [Clostridium botulinum]|uniref:MarR family winged helix-turn-helix transcriptional regulator n=1 Tax=Clostridium botulinum TaxID=1491 RepID=UPI00096D7380|nr:MarR family transcriptional regulator [Clostridium botulinum]MBY6800040.1 MarR family transcriptional regulator [Clostridium botulinum]MBY6996720.1 MarR family transcriptional regulator [Clostridium botulinum]MBY7003827.1 MarR family transcriptional regulator [Clostridium botulinum]MBY7010428.1 MarR family transcriptional regulator [Clostridium botulinum]MCR1145261.1 MarR family transcriptional regulator [Clostridium botulinum]
MMELKNRIRIINEEWTDIYYLLHYIDKENLTHQAIRLLQYIDKNKETTIGDLAKHINTSSNTASEHIKRLIKKGLVTKQRSKVDERKVIVKITEEGKHTLHRHTNLDEAKLKKVLGSLTDSELEIIQKGFLILSEGAKKCLP